ncbi:MAG: AI-2E family transporter [Myxococcota bacterium]
MSDEAPTPEPKSPDPKSDAAADRRRRFLFFGVWGALFVGALVLFRSVLLPFFLAVVVAYVLAPVVRWLEKREVRGRPIPRWVAVVTIYAVFLSMVAGFVAVGTPRLAAEIQKLAREIPETVNTAREEWLPELETRFRSAMGEYSEPAPLPDELDVVTSAAAEQRRNLRVVPSPDGGWEIRLPEEGLLIEPKGPNFRIVEARPREETARDLGAALSEAIENASEDTRSTASTLLKTAQTVIQTVVKGIFTFFIMLMISAYLLITSDTILAFFRSLWPTRRRRSFDRLVLRIDRGLSGVVRGQLLISVVNGVLSGIGFYALELRYWPVLTLIATVLSIIPIFGAILSTIPAVIIALQQGVGTALLITGWIVIIHQIEANLLNPKIMGDAAKVHPVLVVFALLAGESLFGIAGALLAVPVLSISQSLFLHYREVMLGVPTPTRSGRRRARAAP